MKVVIVGGVAGGASAAARIRRLDETAEIVILERSGHISYANCGLPYYIGGVITKEGDLSLQTPESFFKRFRIDVRIRNEVVSIDPGNKCVKVRRLEDGELYEESYDKLLLSPGARPTVPPFAGTDLERVFTLRTVEDTLKIRRFVTERKPRSAVIAGGGFIGIEVAENLRDLGLEVTIVQRPRQLLAPLDEDMASFLHAGVRSHGIRLHLGRTVLGFEQDGEEIKTLIKDEAPLRSDMVILAIGVTPDSTLAKEAGLQTGLKGAILTNERMETSVPDIYAVGDAVQVKHYVSGKEAVISLAGPANKQGRIAADNICGRPAAFKGSMGSSVIKVFELTAAVTGLNEKTASALGIEVEKVVLAPLSHASYYPGAKAMTMKVLCEKKSHRLIGAQIVGRDGVDKRIDVLATAIFAGLKGEELRDLDLAYAPPYSSAKDPVNMAGFMFENIFDGLVSQFHYEDLASLSGDETVTLLDARTPGEYARGHAEGFVNIPLDDLRDRLAEIPKGKPVYVMCQSGLRSYLATRILSQNGFTCYNFSGGYRFFESVSSEKLAQDNTLPCGIVID